MEYQSGAVSPVGSISEGWNIIKDSYWIFFGMMLVTIIILIGVSLVLSLINNAIAFAISAAFGVAAQNTGEAGQISAAIAPQMISMVISIFTNIIVTTLSGVLFCGIYAALSRKVNTGVADFGDLFSGFQKIMPCLIVAAIMSLVQFVIGVGMLLGGAAVGVSAFGMGMLMKDGQFDPSVLGGIIFAVLIFVAVYVVILLIISALTTFVYPLIGERNLSGGEALLLSVKSGFSNLGGIILMMILLFLISMGGAMLCFVGLLFVAPILPASIFAAYQSVFGRTRSSGQYAPPPPPIFNNQPQY